MKNVIEYACILCNQPVIDLDHLPEEYRPALESDSQQSIFPEDERMRILQALESSGGVRQQAADLLNISRSTLYRKLKEYHIT